MPNLKEVIVVDDLVLPLFLVVCKAQASEKVPFAIPLTFAALVVL